MTMYVIVIKDMYNYIEKMFMLELFHLMEKI